jgi:hypothetical protein
MLNSRSTVGQEEFNSRSSTNRTSPLSGAMLRCMSWRAWNGPHTSWCVFANRIGENHCLCLVAFASLATSNQWKRYEISHHCQQYWTSSTICRASIAYVSSLDCRDRTGCQTRRLWFFWRVSLVDYVVLICAELIFSTSRTVATYQTLNREHRLQKFDPSNLKAVIVDEAHHAAAKS